MAGGAFRVSDADCDAALLAFHSTQRESNSLRCCCCWISRLIGVFSALDLVLFYAFWELTLIPMYLFIGVWG